MYNPTMYFAQYRPHTSEVGYLIDFGNEWQYLLAIPITIVRSEWAGGYTEWFVYGLN